MKPPSASPKSRLQLVDHEILPGKVRLQIVHHLLLILANNKKQPCLHVFALSRAHLFASFESCLERLILSFRLPETSLQRLKHVLLPRLDCRKLALRFDKLLFGFVQLVARLCEFVVQVYDLFAR